MKKLVLVGGGGHCKSVIDAVIRSHEFDEIVITDASAPVGTKIMGISVVGSDDMLEKLRADGFEYAFVTIGSIKSTTLRHKVVSSLNDLGYKFPVIIDPSAIVSQSAFVGDGTFIGKNVVLNAEAEVGQHCIINTGTIIEHECSIGEFTHVAVGAVICGGCQIGADCLIGTGSTIIQGIQIGSNSIIGGGALVNSNLADGCTAVGVPARIVGK